MNNLCKNRHLLLLCLIILFSCTQKTDTQFKEEIPFFSVNISDVKKEEAIPLSDLIESLEIIQLENKDEAFSKIRTLYISEKHMGIRSDKDAFKLFDRRGNFINNIGGIGQGPGEYNNIYHTQLDERSKRVYILPFPSDRILVYNLKGAFIPAETILLASKLAKGRFYIDSAKKEVVVTSLPFRNIHDKFCWIQDYNGNILQYSESKHYAVVPDYSSEILSFRNTTSYDFQIADYYQERPDTLFHYNSSRNTVFPVFALKAPTKMNEIIYTYVELPKHYMVKIFRPKEVDKEKMKIILVDKNTQKSKYIHFINDYWGNYELDPLEMNINNGYAYISMEPLELKERLEDYLRNKKMEPKERKHILGLINKFNPNDNNVIMIGKLKQ